MLLVDDLLLLPLRGVLWCVREIYQAAREAQAAEGETIRTRLSELYMLLETGQISEAEFEIREKELLDRLEQVQRRGAGEMRA